MKIDDRAIEGILAKVVRAQEHFLVLKGEMEAWNEDHPWKLIPEMKAEGAKHLYRLSYTKLPPVEWAVLLGEAIHDLRSALEQCVFWLSIDNNGKDIEKTGFPVNSRRKDFFKRRSVTPTYPHGWTTDCGMYKIRGLGSGPQTFIEKLQPYPQRRAPYCMAVKVLHDLWNQDKHRLVHLWGVHLRNPQITLRDVIDPKDCDVWLSRRVIHENAVAAKITCKMPHPHVQMTGNFVGTIAIDVSLQRKGMARGSFWDVSIYTGNIVEKLLSAIGNQGQPIDIITWRTDDGIIP